MAELVVNLNEDIALDILLFCDIFSVLKMEQTCRFFRRVSKQRPIWMTLAMNLDYDHAPNLLPHESLQSLSTDRLREMVIRSTRLYLNWSRPEGPKPTRSIEFKVPTSSIGMDKLLPGGKYFVVMDSNGLFYCYDTDSQERILSYSAAPPGDSQSFQQMDCLLVDEGNTLVLAYGSIRRVDSQISVTVVRFDIHSGTSEIARTFTFAQDDKLIQIGGIVIGHEVVVVQEFGRIFVGDWKTGEARGIMFEREDSIHSSFLIHEHLCVVEEIAIGSIDVSAIPLSVIFRDRSGSSNGKISDAVPFTSVRSEDVLRDSSRVTFLDADQGLCDSHFIASVSVCTSSWKTPSMCEHDAPATPTRILLLVNINESEHMVAELLFSPASTDPSNTPSVISNANDAPQNGCILTYRRQSFAPSYMRRSDDLNFHYLTSATRAGRLFAVYYTGHNGPVSATAINMLDPLEETPSDRPTTSIQNELFLRRAAFTSPMDPLLNDGFGVDWKGIQVESYSGAIWYYSGSTLFIHHTV